MPKAPSSAALLSPSLWASTGSKAVKWLAAQPVVKSNANTAASALRTGRTCSAVLMRPLTSSRLHPSPNSLPNLHIPAVRIRGNNDC
jgi:hypothetical protein